MEILSANNPRVKQWVQLLQKKGRDRQGKFLAEGVHLVQEAIRSGFPIECIVYNKEHGWPNEIKKPGNLECIAVSPAVLKKCTDAKTPQPVFAVMPKLEWQRPHVTDGLFIAVDSIQDPGNLGTIIRSADAAASDGVWIQSGSADIYNPKTVRASMGSLFHVPVIEENLPERFTALQQESKTKIVGTLLEAKKTCYDFDFTGPCCIVIGSEGSGISEQVKKSLTDTVKIPMPGQAESLNAAMAASVLLFEAMRQRRYAKQ